ncbi:MAG: T9SS type A sorting domain-containing protein [bacterium]|nr:T9SS type A sorting domain-containing protein [bacterium]
MKKNRNFKLNTLQLTLFMALVLSAINYQPSTGFAALKDNLSESYLYPNPVRTSLGHDKVTFENLTNNVIIRIFKTNGDIVREINATDTNGTVTWDLTNDNGKKIASGMYLYLITNEAGDKLKGKLAIIR